MRKILVVILAVSLAGCCTPKIIREPVVVQVPILPLPELPMLTKEQEQSIPEDAYIILVKRDETLRQHVNKVNQVIKTHNEGN